MRTRRGYHTDSTCAITCPVATVISLKRTLPSANIVLARSSKRRRAQIIKAENCIANGFEALSDDVVISILAFLSSGGSSPADLINLMLTCKRFFILGAHPVVLANASPKTLAVKAARWSEGAHRFLKRCADSGNIEACFTLGMIRFFCEGDRPKGVALMAKAAMTSHAGALHSLATIQFNGSGGSRKDKNLRAGATLCARAAMMGHVDAMRELGHCLQDGYGLPRNVLEGRKLLLEANAREAAAAIASCPNLYCPKYSPFNINKEFTRLHKRQHVRKGDFSQTVADLRDSGIAVADALRHHSLCRFLQRDCCSLLSDFGCNVPPAESHVANKFLVEWFSLHPPGDGLRLCSHGLCGRPETRKHEFRRCSACGTVNYCSRACQALDWKLRHKYECQPMELDEQDDSEADGDDGDDEENAFAEDIDESMNE